MQLRKLALVVVLGACEAPPAETLTSPAKVTEATATPRPAATAPCPGVPVGVTPPDAADRAAGNVATVRGSFSGDGMGKDADAVCVESGGIRTAHGAQFSAEVRASATELQRITIYGAPILIGIPPGGELTVAYHPCMNWQLGAAWLDDESDMDPKVARYVKRAAACPTGFVDGGEVRGATDPKCGGGSSASDCAWRRCVRASWIELDPSAAAIKQVDADSDGRPLDGLDPARPNPVRPYGAFCPHFDVYDTGTEQVRIAPGVGERWRLALDAAGRLTGTRAR